jgi:uncharacterized protein (TIGR02588 family)
MRIKPAECGEAISLGISIIIVLLLLSYLVLALFQRSDNQYLSIEPRFGDVVSLPDGAYLLPVTVINKGERTVTHAAIGVRLPDEQMHIEIQYLPRGSSRDVYVFVDRDVRREDISIRPAYYRLD